MIISVIFDTEYMGIEQRNKWFLKAVSEAQKEDMIIVTQSYIRDHINEIVDGCDERFYSEFDMQYVSAEEILKMNICFVPDEYFEEIYKVTGSRTKMILDLYNNRNSEIENYIINYVDSKIKEKGFEKPSFIFNCLHVFASVKYLAEYYSCDIIPYVFSCVRKVHGYTNTLYMAHMDSELLNSNAARVLYNEYLNSERRDVCFDRREILALLGKKHNLNLIPFLDCPGEYEMGILGEGFHLIPEPFQHETVTDDDIYYECARHFDASKIITRSHPIFLDQIGIGRKHMKNDPAAFLLSCKRVVTVHSQAIVKAAMWNRHACVMSDSLPYAFLLSNDFDKEDKMSKEDLNFLLFTYFVPDECMFSEKYWKWRKEKPSVGEITTTHLKSILNSVGADDSIMEASEGRFEKLLALRGLSPKKIESIIHESDKRISLNFPLSKVDFENKDGSIVNAYYVNTAEEDNIFLLEFDIPEGVKKVIIYPQNDFDMFISDVSIQIDEEVLMDSPEENYLPKGKNGFVLENLNFREEKKVKMKWRGVTYKDRY